MQAYRAYQMRAYFVGSIMFEQNTILSPTGVTLAHATNYFPHVTHSVNLDYAMAHLDYNREKMEKAQAKYGRDLTLSEPGYLGSVLLSCESDQMTVQDVIDEFDIEPLDRYFARAERFHKQHAEL